MKLGVLVPLNLTATPEFLRALGTTAEKLGFNSLWVGEHVVMVDDYDPNFPVYEDGRMEYEEAADNAELNYGKVVKTYSTEELRSFMITKR